jgi:cell division protein FtsL
VFEEASGAIAEPESKTEETRAKVDSLKRENERLKQLVADLSLQVHILKKTEVTGLE